MVRSRWWGGALGAVVFAFTSLAHAECTKDIDCKGDRVCDAGVCKAPAAVAPQDPPAPAPPAAPAPSGTALQMREPSADAQVERERPKMKRHSVGMMVAGIVMVSVAPFPLIGGVMMDTERATCSSYQSGTYARGCPDGGAAVALTLTGFALIGAGVPMIVIGGKRERAKEPWQAQVLPYATPDGAGLGLQLQL